MVAGLFSVSFFTPGSIRTATGIISPVEQCQLAFRQVFFYNSVLIALKQGARKATGVIQFSVSSFLFSVDKINLINALRAEFVTFE